MAAGEWTRFSASLTRFSSTMRASDIAGVSGAALAVKRSIESHAASVGAGRLGKVRYDVKGTANPTALIKATDGRAHFFERGTDAHQIGPDLAGRRRQIARALSALYGGTKTRGRVRKNLRKGGLFWSGANHPHTKPITHPGMNARPFFWPGVEDATPRADDAYRVAVDRNAQTAFR